MGTQTESPAAAPAPARPAVPRVLVVDDEQSMREVLSIVLRRDGYEVILAADGRAAVKVLRQERVDVLIADIRMPEMTGVDLLREAQVIDPGLVTIIMTAFATTDTAVDALGLGAADYVHKSPTAVNELRLRVRKEIERKRLQQENVLLKRALGTPHAFANLIGASSAMVAVFELVEAIAPTTSTVLITGESGTGKELVARAIHAGSSRSDRPFVAVNCGTLPETLLDSELFGHMRGAFTGADANKKGLLEAAEKGTILLDEIGEMSPIVQLKLLRVLEERKFRRLGGTDEAHADIRIVAATSRDLSKMVAAGQFREDLFHRINVVRVKLPPLRERQDDIPALAEHFVMKYATCMKRDVQGISGAAMACLRSYEWPGNVRELENAMERAVALEQTPTVLPDSLPETMRAATAVPAVAPLPSASEDLALRRGFDLEQHVQGVQRDYIAEALRRSNGVKKNAAELLGLSFRQFRYLLKKYSV